MTDASVHRKAAFTYTLRFAALRYTIRYDRRV